ncbi:MAG: hypothetical protein ABSA65_19795 [Acidimicrobiales bacterium]|jgi:hypothetical protein
MSRQREIAMVTLRGDLLFAFVLGIVKVVQVAIGDWGKWTRHSANVLAGPTLAPGDAAEGTHRPDECVLAIGSGNCHFPDPRTVPVKV